MAARLTAYLVVAIVSATLIAGLIVGAQRDDNGPVDLIVHNAAVYTADRSGTMAEAVAVRGNQILRVGSDREILRLQRPQTVVIDARGGAVVPGFNDSLLDLMRGGLRLASVDLRGAGTAAEIEARVAGWSAAHPDSDWIVGHGWSAEHFRSGFPARQFLDAITGDRPALLSDEDGRTSWVNTEALRRAGITRDTPDPADGAIVRDARTGEPSGVLRGSAIRLAADVVPAPTKEARRHALRTAMASANAAGITSVQSPTETADTLELYDELRRAGDLTVRIHAGLELTAPPNEGDLAHLRPTKERFADDPLLKAGALTIRLDGSSSARLRGPARPGPATAGDLFDRDALNRTARLADAAGWQLIVDAEGERAIGAALDAFAHAERSNREPTRGRRHRISGIAAVSPADVSRFGSLGVVASLQPGRPAGAPARRPESLTRASPHRTGLLLPIRTLADETRVVFGSRWPAADINPLIGLLAATRKDPEGPLAAGESGVERLPLAQAVDAYTASSAWASFDEQRKGSLTPGMLADLTVLSDNIFDRPADRLARASVAFTIFDGRVVYSGPAGPDREPTLTMLER